MQCLEYTLMALLFCDCLVTSKCSVSALNVVGRALQYLRFLPKHLKTCYCINYL